MRKLFGPFASSQTTATTATNDNSAAGGAYRDLGKAEFAIKLLRATSEQEPGRNVLISPVSIAMVMHVLYDGSRGRTQDELANVLEITGWSPEDIDASVHVLTSAVHNPSADVQLTIATSVWAAECLRLQPEFTARVLRVYQAEVQKIRFGAGAVRSINDWVSAATKGKIVSIIEQISPLARLIAVNALYFKAPWTDPFSERFTRLRKFTLSNGSVIDAPFMAKKSELPYYEDDHLQAVRLSYARGRYGMDILLPKTSPRKLLREMGAAWWHSRNYGWREGYLEVPRFTLSVSYALEGILKRMGLASAFHAGAADFSAVSPDPIQLDAVCHKALVEVNERGTEAAAATAATMVLGIDGSKPRPFHMILDRPFIFAICDVASGALLFSGVLEDPRG